MTSDPHRMVRVAVSRAKPAPSGTHPIDACLREEIGASREREAPMHRVRPAGRHDPRIVLVDRDDLVGDVPRRPARDEGCRVEDLVLHALLAHRRDIGVGLVDRIAGKRSSPPVMVRSCSPDSSATSPHVSNAARVNRT